MKEICCSNCAHFIEMEPDNVELYTLMDNHDFVDS